MSSIPSEHPPSFGCSPNVPPFHFTSLPTSHSCLSKLHPHHWQNILGDFTMALTAGGGIMGYVRTRSVPSLVAGSAVGILYGIGGYRLQNREPYGIELSLLASIILGGSAIPRAIRLRKPVPILLSVLSAFGLFTFGSAYRQKL
ncbi:hypothetical protein ACCO45_001194 [Purpureocillium lilacinum]|uniref:Uncharacterized protein n=1 Tax=Purpureocillium lilacinum TaxID=33203 RepID=A0ACC4E928_PURLI